MRKYAVALVLLFVASGCGSSTDLATTASEELLVLSAIAEFMPDGQVCEEQLLSADSPERGWEGWGGAGWKAEVDGFEELVVQITCDITSEEFWFKHELRIRYPLKTGEAAEVINSAVRSEVAKGILDYFNDSRQRFSELRLTEGEQRSDQTQHRGCGPPGYLVVDGVVTYSTDALYSVYLPFGQNHPCANTTDDPVVTLNFDLLAPNPDDYFKPHILRISDLFTDGITNSDWEEAIRELTVTVHSTLPGTATTMTSWFLRSIDFNLGPDTLILHTTADSPIRFSDWCCGTTPDHAEIRYEELADYLDPNGPYRHILNN